jgi:hypothetical protein
MPASRFQLFPENMNNFHPANSNAWLAASNSPGQSSPFREHFLHLVAHSMAAVAWVLARARPAPLFVLELFLILSVHFFPRSILLIDEG